MSLWELKESLRPAVKTPQVAPFVQMVGERAFYNAPLAEPVLISSADFYTEFAGRMVAAAPNLNLATWYEEDLRYGIETVPGGPVNFLHDQSTVVGCITSANLAVNENQVTHIAIEGRLWNWLAPNIVDRVVEEYQSRGAWLSMECVPQSLECQACMARVPFDRADIEGCAHMSPRTAAVRMVNPVFLGVALIIAPEAPGWPGATIDYISAAVEKACTIDRSC